MLLLALIGFLVFLPQMIYWKFATGNYMFNSYVGEGFFFDNPHILKGLFSFRKGWLLYTPVMVLSLAGMIYLWNKVRSVSLAVWVLFGLYLYVVFSWWNWWYGGSFGQRALIDLYPVLAIPFAAFLLHATESARKYKAIVIVFISLCTLLNFFQTIQAKYNIIHFDSMTRESYFRYFFSTTKSPDREQYLDHPDNEKALRGEEIE
jgi:hypothetical protein